MEVGGHLVAIIISWAEDHSGALSCGCTQRGSWHMLGSGRRFLKGSGVRADTRRVSRTDPGRAEERVGWPWF